jgi:hypothetical protein
MRVGLIVAAVVALIVTLGVFLGVSINVGPVFSVCSRGDELNSTDRAEIVEAGQRFMGTVRSGDAADVLASMSEDVQDSTELPAVEQALQGARSESPNELMLDEVFSAFTPIGSRNGVSLCGPPSQPALLARHGGMRVGLVTFREPMGGGERTWVLYLERDRGEWRVRHFYYGLSAIGGRDGAWFRDRARAEASAGHNFNATILYDGAAMTLDRGENFQTSAIYGLSEERAALSRHADIDGPLPHTFRLGGQAFEVERMDVTGTGDRKIVLLLQQSSGQPGSRDEAIARNHAFIDAMNEHRPEWREAFDALVVSYPTGGNTIWRTVYERDNGYGEAEAPGDATSAMP